MPAALTSYTFSLLRDRFRTPLWIRIVLILAHTGIKAGGNLSDYREDKVKHLMSEYNKKDTAFAYFSFKVNGVCT